MTSKATALRAIREHCGPEVCPALKPLEKGPLTLTQDQRVEACASNDNMRTFSWAMAVIVHDHPARCPICKGKRRAIGRYDCTERCLVGRVLGAMEA